MGLENNSGKLIFVNIKEGKLYIKPKESEAQFFDSLSGTITKVSFDMDEYNGQKFERAKITLVDGEDKFLLQMRTDSGYFRGFCNSLKTGDPKERVKISPNYKEENGARPQTTCFVEQFGKVLKHAYTKLNPGDLPQLEEIVVRGQKIWDGTKQIEFWKDWLSGIYFTHEAVVTDSPTPRTQSDIPEPASITEPIDDLPF